MKNTLFTLLFGLIVSVTFATNAENVAVKSKTTESTVSIPVATNSVMGKVIDLNSGEALVGVEITIEGSTRKAYTDLDGNFKIDNLQSGSYNVIASYISYSKSFIEKLEVKKSNQELNIKLQSAN